MERFAQILRHLLVAAWLGAAGSLFAQPKISEVLLDPPALVPRTFQYIELRGRPNELLLPDTYFVAVEGDTNGNPGTIQNVFDLSGQRMGGNGFLLILQQSNTFNVVLGAMVLQQNGSQDGFGSGNGSTVGHRGEGGRTDLEGPSVTFILVQTTNRPVVGDDLDANNDGIPDASWFASWIIHDSVGILDNSGLGDIAYGAINFRRNPGAQASGTIISTSFTPDYVARTGNTTGALADDWVASSGLIGTAPYCALGDAIKTVPASFAGQPLNHIGGPNFGAAIQSGVSVQPNKGGVTLAEGSTGNGLFTIAFTTSPTGPVTIRLQAASDLEFSLDAGATYVTDGNVVLSGTAPVNVRARLLASSFDWVEGLPHRRLIQFAVTETADPAHYPLSTIIPEMPVHITDDDFILLNEIKANPPGADQPWEYFELMGTPGARLTNLWLVAIAGNPDDNPGEVTQVIDLNGAQMGVNGLLVLGATQLNYALDAGTAYWPCAAFSTDGGALPNQATTFLLLASRTPPQTGQDWDGGDNGKLEGLPVESLVLDSVAFMDANPNSIAYSPAILRLSQGVPDAATRYPGNADANATNGWFYGQLAGTNGNTLTFDASAVGPNFPYGYLLTPGASNAIALVFSSVGPLAGAIGDLTNPEVFFNLTNLLGSQATLWAVSDNPAVVANSNLILTANGPNAWALEIRPHGVGYATLSLEASAGGRLARLSFPYAASAMGRPDGRFHAGAADASTAIPLDDQWMLVGDDENQVLRLYARNASGPPVWQTNLTPFLGLTDIEAGVPREVDIEASVRVGDRIFWLGAHSHANIAEGRTNRSRLFATDLSGAGTNITLAYVGRYDYLKLDLVNWDAGNLHGKGANYYGLAASTEEGVDPKSPGGFNIEGLAMAPGSSTTAYVALRAPIVPTTNRCYALIVPVVNFPSLAGTNLAPGTALFGTPIELDLFGRGFRSLEGGPNGYLIVGGTPLNVRGPYPDDPKLYVWTGLPQDAPRELTANLDGLNPEAIVGLPPPPWNSNAVVQIISDNGVMDWYGDGTQAKFLPVREFRKYRSDSIALGNITVPAPILQPLRQISVPMMVSWRATAGVTYRLQYKTNLNDAVWREVGPAVTAPGPWASLVDTNVQFKQRFYRIITP